jgi:hypothetical protein
MHAEIILCTTWPFWNVANLLFYFSFCWFLGDVSLMTESPRAPSTLNRDCPCGFYDSATLYLLTDALIIHFNETTIFPCEDFTISPVERNEHQEFKFASFEVDPAK